MYGQLTGREKVIAQHIPSRIVSVKIFSSNLNSANAAIIPEMVIAEAILEIRICILFVWRGRGAEAAGVRAWATGITANYKAIPPLRHIITKIV